MFKTKKRSAAEARPSLRARADAARDARDWRSAAALYEQVLAECPPVDRAALWVQAGHCRKEAGDLGGALDAYERGMALAPVDADIHLQMGHLHKIAGRPDQAGESYAAALRLDPGSEDARVELARMHPQAKLPGTGAEAPRRDVIDRADEARDAGRWAEAAALYAEHLAAAPDAPGGAWVQLGHARKEAGDRDGAVLAYETALGLDPDDAEIHVHLGHLHKTMGAVGAAMASLTEALRLAPHLRSVDDDLRGLAALHSLPPVRFGPAVLDGGPCYALPLPWTGDRTPFQTPFPPVYAGLSRRFSPPDADAS